jgi:tRNA (guanine-N7-)-methyltransferase
VRKHRRLTPDELAPYVVELSDPVPVGAGPDAVPRPEKPIDWTAVFGNDRPVEVEVGFGKGLFLVTAGQSRPDRNFFGIEVVRKYQLYAATRAAVRKLANVKTCCADAKRVFRVWIPAGSVAAVHVYFPDPWWKTRHKKRLLFTPEFAQSVLRALAPGGHLHFVSDVADYFEMVTGTLAAVSGFRPLPSPDAAEPVHDMDYLTNFERKFRKEGRPIHRSLYEKVEVNPA